jgi:hypothetical protein
MVCFYLAFYLMGYKKHRNWACCLVQPTKTQTPNWVKKNKAGVGPERIHSKASFSDSDTYNFRPIKLCMVEEVVEISQRLVYKLRWSCPGTCMGLLPLSFFLSFFLLGVIIMNGPNSPIPKKLSSSTLLSLQNLTYHVMNCTRATGFESSEHGPTGPPFPKVHHVIFILFYWIIVLQFKSWPTMRITFLKIKKKILDLGVVISNFS